jgi:hypothetical protein
VYEAQYLEDSLIYGQTYLVNVYDHPLLLLSFEREKHGREA